MKEKDQKICTGAGWVIYWKGAEKRIGGEGMGGDAEVYDAEMLALLKQQSNTKDSTRRGP